MSAERTCPECGGFGQLYDEATGDDEKCQRCDGHGTIDSQPFGEEKLTREELNAKN